MDTPARLAADRTTHWTSRRVLGVLALLGAASCTSLHRLSAQDFMQTARRAPETMRTSVVLSVRHERAYLERSEMGAFAAVLGLGFSTDVCWVPTSELTPEELAFLQECVQADMARGKQP